MNEQEKQEFVVWLQTKTGIKDPNEFEAKIKEMGEEGIRSAYEEFKKSKKTKMKIGGILEYVKCITSNKKGGKVKGCGCGSKMKKK